MPFSAAYDELYPLALRTADRVLRDRPAAEDVAQDVFTDLWRGRASFDRSRGSLPGYVSMLSRSRALDRWRTRTAREAAAERLQKEVVVAWRSADGPEDQALLHRRVEDAVRALDAIPDKQREALPLAYAGGMTANAVADAVGVPLGTAKSRIRGGLQGLRAQLAAWRHFSHLHWGCGRIPRFDCSHRSGASRPRLAPSLGVDALEDLAAALRARLIERARAGEAGGGSLDEEVSALVEREAGPLPEADRSLLAERVVLLATGLGPLEPLLSDSSVDEVMVNGPGEVYVERAGRVEPGGVAFAGEAELMHAIERILAPLGRRVDESSPLCDARLADGSRVNVVIPPLSLSGPCLTIRRFRREGFSLRDLVGNDTLAPDAAELLALCVTARASVLVSGGTGSGKTTTLNALSGAIPAGERIVTIEDAAELRLRQRHVIRLEARPPNLEGRGEVTIRQLVRNALRMRPDRIVVGEVRGAEALDMLQALNTGHEGSLTTVHANSPADALRRVETLALMAGVGLPHSAVREQVASALDVVVHQDRLSDGSRRIDSICEVVRVAGGAGTRELYRRGRPLRRPVDGELAARLQRVGGG